MASIELLSFYWVALGSSLSLSLFTLLGWFKTKSNYFKFLKIKVTIVSLWRNKSNNYIFMAKLAFTCVCMKLCSSMLFFTHFLYQYFDIRNEWGDQDSLRKKARFRKIIIYIYIYIYIFINFVKNEFSLTWRKK